MAKRKRPKRPPQVVETKTRNAQSIGELVVCEYLKHVLDDPLSARDGYLFDDEHHFLASLVDQVVTAAAALARKPVLALERAHKRAAGWR